MSIKSRSFLAWLLSASMSPRSCAQQTLGGITGTVTDSSGAVIAAATMTIAIGSYLGFIPDCDPTSPTGSRPTTWRSRSATLAIWSGTK
jgi:hypothetical protein